ncbi:MAG: response regulator [Gallionella sp.]|nr:response regulator [Gallionella sp.]
MITEQEILNASILIVDDQQSNVQLLVEMLREAGYKSTTSTMDPHAVCALYRDNHYDLILLDLLMPGMDGFQVMEALKDVETGGYLPVLVLTAEPGHKIRALASGAKDFIAKPFDLFEVKTRIRNMLEVRLLYKKLDNYNKQLEQTVQQRTAELRESEARFKRLTELSCDWYWEQDENGKFINVYGPAMEMLGLPLDTAVEGGGQAWRWNEDERRKLAANMAMRKPFLDFVYSRTYPDGKQQYFMVSGEPMFDASGGFTGYRGIGKDVTATIYARVKAQQ